jgi:hypothetical protein
LKVGEASERGNRSRAGEVSEILVEEGRMVRKVARGCVDFQVELRKIYIL